MIVQATIVAIELERLCDPRSNQTCAFVIITIEHSCNRICDYHCNQTTCSRASSRTNSTVCAILIAVKLAHLRLSSRWNNSFAIIIATELERSCDHRFNHTNPIVIEVFVRNHRCGRTCCGSLQLSLHTNLRVREFHRDQVTLLQLSSRLNYLDRSNAMFVVTGRSSTV